MFQYHTTIKMYDVDAAGILFFANQFRLIHDAYEALLESRGFPLGVWLKKAPFFLPVVYAQSSFKLPLHVGDHITIHLSLKTTSETSLTLGHEILKNNSEPAGSGETVHVCIDRKTGEKIPLPNQLLALID